MTKNFCDICGTQLPRAACRTVQVATKCGINRNGQLEALDTTLKPMMMEIALPGEYCGDCQRIIVTNLIPSAELPGMGAKKFGS